jgi:diadenosine tetraphosphate (Ap4A) HIT family hydrolase
MNESQVTWLILVPRRTAVKEIYQLNQDDQAQLQIESVEVGSAIMREFNGDKLNVAALGNMVPQLHVHLIVRHQTDPMWPQPVWGNLSATAYSEDAKQVVQQRLLSCLSTNTSGFIKC